MGCLIGCFKWLLLTTLEFVPRALSYVEKVRYSIDTSVYNPYIPSGDLPIVHSHNDGIFLSSPKKKKSRLFQHFCFLKLSLKYFLRSITYPSSIGPPIQFLIENWKANHGDMINFWAKLLKYYIIINKTLLIRPNHPR